LRRNSLIIGMKFLLLFLTLLLTGTVNKPTGNVPLHEKTETRTPDYSTEKGYFDNVRTEPVVTWVFEEGTFVPAAKLTEKEQYSIVTNYLGTPEAMYRDDGEAVWTCELNSYGKVRDYRGESKTMCPFRYQGQYEDAETGLYYNRFRYYSPEEGVYLSQDPIGINGGISLYAYVHDTNSWIDEFGLQGGQTSFIGDALHPGTVTPDNSGGVYTIIATGSYQGDKEALYGKAQLKESFSPEYVAHHISYDPETNTMKMQLVKQDVHSKVSHIGGVKDYEAYTGEKYTSSKKPKTGCES
jgi:RHS repeat-associated protein